MVLLAKNCSTLAAECLSDQNSKSSGKGLFATSEAVARGCFVSAHEHTWMLKSRRRLDRRKGESTP